LCWCLTARHDWRNCASGEAAHTAILHAFDLIEHDGEDLRNRLFLDHKAALARLLRETEASIVLSEHVAEDGPPVSPNRSCLPMGFAAEATPGCVPGDTNAKSNPVS